MKVRFKKLHETSKAPYKANQGDAGFDLSVFSYEFKGNQIIYHTGLSFEIPSGYVGLVYPRSSVVKSSVRLANCVGVIDSGYRGEVMAVFDVIDRSAVYVENERCCQLIIQKLPDIEFEEADELSPTHRGIGGYGSSGK